MTTTVGRVEFNVIFDGRNLPRQAREIGEKAGKQGGESYSDGFNKELDKGLTDAGRLQVQRMRAWEERAGRSGKIQGLTYIKASQQQIRAGLDAITADMAKAFNTDTGLDEYAGRFESVDKAVEKLRSNLRVLSQEARIGNQAFEEGSRALDEWETKARDSERANLALRQQAERLAVAQKELEDRTDNVSRAMGNTAAFDRHVRRLGDVRVAYADLDNKLREIEKRGGNTNWISDQRLKLLDLAEAFEKSAAARDKDSASMDRHSPKLSHNVRQAIVLTGAILAAGEQISVLGSAAGAGLTVLGAALQGGLIGAIGAITVFGNLGKELDELDESIRPAAAAFQALKEPLAELQLSMQQIALSGAEEAFNSIGNTIRELTPAFTPLAEVIGRLLEDFATGIEPGSRGFETIQRAIEASAPVFDKLVRLAGELGLTLLDLFSNPRMVKSVERFLGYLDEIIGRIDDFSHSSGLDEWLDNADRIFGEFGELLDGVGRTLNNLVTPESVERTAAFIQNLTDSLPFFQQILETLGELDVFGLIAELLATVGSALTPLLGVLEPIASIINSLLTVAFNNLAIALMVLQPGIELLTFGWNILALAFDKVVEYLTPLWDNLQLVGEAVSQTADAIWTALEPAIGDVMDAIIELLPNPEELARIINDDVIPAIRDFGDWLVKYAVPALQDLAHWIRDEAGPAIQKFGQWIVEDLLPFLGDMVGKLTGAWKGFQSFSDNVKRAIDVILTPLRNLIDLFGRLFDAAQSATSAAGKASSKNYSFSGVPATATGGTFNGSQIRRIAEAGPEAVVPLNRPLSMVDPSVRGLSAIAQGKAPGMASGGVVGAGRNVTFEAGAIVVQEAADGRRSAVEISNEVAERVLG